MNTSPDTMNSAVENKPAIAENHATIASSTSTSGSVLPKSLAEKYEYLQNLGSGSQATVCKARNRLTNDLVAIKLLRIDQIENWKAYDLFDREASVLKRLNIPGVAKCYEALKCFDDNPPYACIVQEFVNGISLDALMKSGKRLTLTETFQIALQILNILEKLHKSNPPVIHRDLKPANIMISQNNGKTKVYLIDFGAVSNPLVQTGGSTVAGTFGYMPPEQLMGKPSPESDLYALAATIVCMLSGVSPADLQTLEFRLVIEPHLQSFPPAITHVLARMLDPSLNTRLTDYDEIRRTFNNFINGAFDDDAFCDNTFCTSDEFVSRFNNVKTLWDAGNLKLWSALPEQTPRIVPNDLLSRKSADLMSHRSIRSEFNKQPSHIAALILTSACILCIIPFLKYFYRFLSDWTFYEAGDYVSFAILLLSSTAFFVVLLLFLWYGFGSPRFTSSEILRHSKHKNTHDVIYQLRNRLLQSGRKTIATVVSIQYKPVTDLASEQYCLKDKHSYNHYETHIHNIPSFEISYKFNPPDDSQTEDLVHHIVVHRDTTSHLQPGDPLLILYMIQPDNNELVCSMPFPFAACDVENYEEIICITSQGTPCNIAENPVPASVFSFPPRMR